MLFWIVFVKYNCSAYHFSCISRESPWQNHCQEFQTHLELRHTSRYRLHCPRATALLQWMVAVNVEFFRQSCNRSKNPKANKSNYLLSQISSASPDHTEIAPLLHLIPRKLKKGVLLQEKNKSSPATLQISFFLRCHL